MSNDRIITEVERLRRQEAEGQRDLAVGIAASEAIGRDNADKAAMNANMDSKRAEYKAATLSAEKGVMRENLDQERENSRNATFGFYALGFFVLAALTALGIWYFTGPGNPNNVATVAPTNTTIINPTQPQSPPNVIVQPSDSRPIVIPPSNPPPTVKVDVHMPKSAPQEAPVMKAPPVDKNPDKNPDTTDSGKSDTPKPDTSGGGN